MADPDKSIFNFLKQVDSKDPKVEDEGLPPEEPVQPSGASGGWGEPEPEEPVTEEPTPETTAAEEPPETTDPNVDDTAGEDNSPITPSGEPDPGLTPEEFEKELTNMTRSVRLADRLKDIEELRMEMPTQQRTDFDRLVKEAYADYRENIDTMNKQEAFTALGISVAQLLAIAYAGANGSDLTGIKLMTEFPSFENQRRRESEDFRTQLDDIRGQQAREDKQIDKQQDSARRDFEFERNLKLDALKTDVDMDNRMYQEKFRDLLSRRRDSEARRFKGQDAKLDREARKEATEADREFKQEENALDRALRKEIANLNNSKSSSTEIIRRQKALENAKRLSTDMQMAEDDKDKAKIYAKLRQELVNGGMTAEEIDAMTTQIEPPMSVLGLNIPGTGGDIEPKPLDTTSKPETPNRDPKIQKYADQYNLTYEQAQTIINRRK